MSTRDERPPVWVGHVTMQTDRLAESREFMIKLGMRPIADGEDFAVLELRGGTHLVLNRSDTTPAGSAAFDLMVDDLDVTHKKLSELGFSPSEIKSERIHRSFKVKEPSGQEITFNSSHVGKQPV